ncbi:5437_t:CDS:1 [Dentiscutata erythropus]|uniref:5437_t:CDS:1 n=1 Tax=Dentiscutata erythropus TaxID=1348616 RepID=A0A9N9P0Y8_9GLOM|nr:5437_t:CDS:1 [Dentiscutata erythropus]
MNNLPFLYNDDFDSPLLYTDDASNLPLLSINDSFNTHLFHNSDTSNSLLLYTNDAYNLPLFQDNANSRFTDNIMTSKNNLDNFNKKLNLENTYNNSDKEQQN